MGVGSLGFRGLGFRDKGVVDLPTIYLPTYLPNFRVTYPSESVTGLFRPTSPKPLSL